jgi:hypothetical protein
MGLFASHTEYERLQSKIKFAKKLTTNGKPGYYYTYVTFDIKEAPDPPSDLYSYLSIDSVKSDIYASNVNNLLGTVVSTTCEFVNKTEPEYAVVKDDTQQLLPIIHRKFRRHIEDNDTMISSELTDTPSMKDIAGFYFHRKHKIGERTGFYGVKYEPDTRYLIVGNHNGQQFVDDNMMMVFRNVDLDTVVKRHEQSQTVCRWGLGTMMAVGMVLSTNYDKCKIC